MEQRPEVMYDVKIPMRDGVNLAANVYFPKNRGKTPVLLNVTPYIKDGGVKSTVRTVIRSFVKAGYAVVHTDVRGRGNSEGEFTPNFQEIEDVHDALEWCGTQPWSNGRVGTFGRSYGGASQLYTIRLGSKYHKAAFIECAPSIHPFRDCTAYAYGVYMPIMRAWQALITGKTNKEEIYDDEFDWEQWLNIRPLKDWAKRVGLSEDIQSHLYEHETYDAYMKRVWSDEMIEQMSVPCYFVTGWFDDSISGAMDHFPRLLKHHDPKVRRSQRLLVGPWAHPLSAPYRPASKLGDFEYGPDSVVQLHKEAVRWFDYWLKGKDNGMMKEPPVRLFHMVANKWMDLPEFPLSGSSPRELLLAADGPANTLDGKGRLGGKQGRSRSSRFTYDPSKPTPTPFWKEAFQNGTNEDLRYIQKRKDVLVFTSEPMGSPLDMVGMLGCELYVSTTAVDTDFVTRLSDVGPDGYAQRLQHGIIRLRFRDGFEEPKLVKPGEIVKVRTNMWATSHRFAKDHSIRLEVTSSAFPSYAPNLNTGGSTWEETEPIVAKQTVYHSKEYPSKLTFQEVPNPKFSPAWTADRWE
jgi:uncharacterized protein